MDQKKLALIHIVKKELALSDEEYRGILKKSAGVESAKDLTDETFKKVMNYFVRSKHYRINPEGLTIKQKLFIKYLAEHAGWDADHLNNFIHKNYNKRSVDTLDKKEASKVIEALKQILRRGHPTA